MKGYYTYVLIDPRDLEPFYVGKGTWRRMKPTPEYSKKVSEGLKKYWANKRLETAANA